MTGNFVIFADRLSSPARAVFMALYIGGVASLSIQLYITDINETFLHFSGYRL